MFFGSQLMEDDRTLYSYNIKRQRDPSDVCCLQMMKTGPRPAGAHSPTHRVTGGPGGPAYPAQTPLDPPFPRDFGRPPLPGAPPKAAPGEF